MKSVIIFGQKINIVRKKGLMKEESIYGLYEPENSTIYVDDSLNKKQFVETLIHECGHALFHRAGLSQSKITRDLEEIVVDQFSIMFSENLSKFKKL